MEVARLKRVLARVAAVLGILLAGYFIFAPTGRYLLRAAWEEARILARRRPIAEVIADPSTDARTRARLEIVLAAKRYASDSLGLTVDGSFSTFVRLRSDTLVLVLSAARRDLLIPRTWWFPVVGRVPYKGFFDTDAARAERRHFADEGWDVHLRPASAFSTLGYFDDPLLSTTLRQDSVDLANTVIHELTHSTYYAKGKATFNESFASFVGARGAAAFFRSRGDSVAAALADARWEDEKTLGAFWRSLYATLDSAFAQHPDDREARLAARAAIYRDARVRLVNDLGPRLRAVSPRYPQRVPLDNAALLARRVYGTDLALFDSVYEASGRDVRRAAARVVKSAAAQPDKPWDAVRALLRPPETRSAP